jgi:hypothetical protein
MKVGIIAVAAGTALMALTLFFSSGYHPMRGFLGNVQTMEIVFVEGRYVKGEGHSISDLLGHYEGRFAIPTRWLVAASSLVIIGGFALTAIACTSHGKR